MADVHDDEGVAQKQFERGQWAQVTIFGNPQSALPRITERANANDNKYNLVDVDRDIEQLKHVAAAVGRTVRKLCNMARSMLRTSWMVM